MKCPYCKADISDDSQFCGNCGKKLTSKANSSPNYTKIVIACLVACVFIGGGWYVGSFFFFNKEVFPTFESFLALVDDCVKNGDLNEQIAKECGLEKIYSVEEDEGEYTSIEIVCGKDVEKGGPHEYRKYDIVAKSDHAVYIVYSADTSSGGELYFKDKKDCDSFLKKAMDYGLLIHRNEYEDSERDTYYVPKKKLPNGSVRVEKLDYDGEYGLVYALLEPKYENGWYVIRIGIDF